MIAEPIAEPRRRGTVCLLDAGRTCFHQGNERFSVPQCEIAHPLILHFSDAPPRSREHSPVVDVDVPAVNLARTRQHPIRRCALLQIVVLAMGEHTDFNEGVRIKKPIEPLASG